MTASMQTNIIGGSIFRIITFLLLTVTSCNIKSKSSIVESLERKRTKFLFPFRERFPEWRQRPFLTDVIFRLCTRPCVLCLFDTKRCHTMTLKGASPQPKNCVSKITSNDVRRSRAPKWNSKFYTRHRVRNLTFEVISIRLYMLQSRT